MRRIPFLLAAALLVAGCKQSSTPEKTAPQAESAPPPTAPAAQPALEKSHAELEQAAKEPGAQRFHVVSPRGEGDIVVKTLTAGTGQSPKATDTVKVNYRGTLADGTEFDSSYKRGQPATFPLNRVVPCWTEGLQHMKVGEKAKITCSSETAYGSHGAGGVIPPNATLTFEVELLGING
jgi:FKBP-type peptidyl-prolyl cis-trans isomerase FkpA